MNPLWNSRTLDEKSRDTEDFSRAMGLNILNVGLSHLLHNPQNISFPDITLDGDNGIVTWWKFLDLPSLSDHPYIYFLLNNSDVHFTQTLRTLKSFPRLSACSTDNFISLLNEVLNLFATLDFRNHFPTSEIDIHVSKFTDLLHLCEKRIRLPHYRSLANGKMPWWGRKLWALCFKSNERIKQSVCCYRLRTEIYFSIKSKYQKRLRQRKTKSWKEFRTKNFIGDLCLLQPRSTLVN